MSLIEPLEVEKPFTLVICSTGSPDRLLWTCRLCPYTV